MKRFIKAALNAGRRPSQPIVEQKLIRSLNLGCLVAVLLAFLLIILNGLTGYYILAVTYFVSIIFSSAVIVLQGYGHYRTARYLAVFESMAVFSFVALAYHNSVELLLLFNILTIVLLFDNPWERYSLGILNVALFTCTRLYVDTHPPLISALPFLREIMSYVVACTFLGLIIANYKKDQRHNRQLLENMNRRLKEKAETLKNLNETKEKVLSILSRDLRQPLASMKSLVALSDDVTPAEFTSFTKKVENHLDNGLLSLENTMHWAHSQMKGQEAIPEACKVNSTLLPLKVRFEETLKAKAITLLMAVPENARVHVDPEHFSIMLRNLLSNAIKYTPRGGIVSIAARQKLDHMELAITDTGIGIDPALMERLFDLELHFTCFGTENEHGVGLGLLVVKELAELNNGAVKLSSEPGKGTVVQLSLPLC
ncbi:sensor histidine kinase [Chitinophaga niabensis]|uniref:histidine kinase n=1 Tax=Chitinophaga niabensis TaxID=536979 RepID=A0A1N6DA15_9BACT|nr:HAMP domain-containing sensor histidine kinase [Chitinophaga niabensis]SIN67642.1 Signal transduction histidine kinase [Chitinophaga niabensis]